MRAEAASSRRSRNGTAARLLSQPLAVAGLAVTAVHLLLALLSPVLAPYGASEIVGNVLQPPGDGHLLGTDQIGRDYLSRVMAGGRIALLVALMGVSLACVGGLALGLLAGYLGGRFDEVAMRLVDALLSIPDIILIAILVLTLGKDIDSLTVIVAFVYMPSLVRVIRARTISLSALDFVRAAELRGETPLAIVLRELLPNTLPILSVEFAIRCSSAILRISALSFLGLGISPPTPDWGLMVQEAMGVVFTDPWLLLFPALMLSSLILGINFAVDGIARAIGVRTLETTR